MAIIEITIIWQEWGYVISMVYLSLLPYNYSIMSKAKIFITPSEYAYGK